jgi:hypothetical protein
LAKSIPSFDEVTVVTAMMLEFSATSFIYIVKIAKYFGQGGLTEWYELLVPVRKFWVRNLSGNVI